MRGALGRPLAVVGSLSVLFVVFVVARLTTGEATPMRPGASDAEPTEPGSVDPRRRPVVGESPGSRPGSRSESGATDEGRPDEGRPSASKAELEARLREHETELAQERDRLFAERFERGQFEELDATTGPLRPERSHDGLDVAVSWRYAERDGRRVVQVTTLPLAEYPDYYRRAAERERLVERIERRTD